MTRLGLVGALAVLALAACTGGSDDPVPTAPTGDGASSSPSETSAASPTSPDPSGTAGSGVDCDAVDAARAGLTDATNAELERLQIDRSDPRAFSVQVIVASQQAFEYWSAVEQAVASAGPELRADAATVVGYWEPLDAELDAIELPDGSEAAVAAATQRYVELSEQYPDEEVVPAQERLTADVDAACGQAATP